MPFAVGCQRPASMFAVSMLLGLLAPAVLVAGEFAWKLRDQRPADNERARWESRVVEQVWQAEQTAVIVCDVWDLHHCRNAVRRLEEFAPRLDALLAEARRRGATIIHSPSDCMPAYADHPARRRAVETPLVEPLPEGIQHWCSRIPAEHGAVYPIDQSDGGEDDDPAEHAAWAEHLRSLGRNPGTPWQRQSDLIHIDADRDYISDRGDEVWSILQRRGIQRVVLTGVHTNMCVLGRPFGLRQMVSNNMPVVLVRDLTDCMYNPRQWPHVDHFTGNDLIIDYVERHICPTVTSDQLLGGKPVRSRFDTRDDSTRRPELAPPALDDLRRDWRTIAWGDRGSLPLRKLILSDVGPVWFRCAFRAPSRQLDVPWELLVRQENEPQAWVNGHPLRFVRQPQVEGAGETASWKATIGRESLAPDDANLLVLRQERAPHALSAQLSHGDTTLRLAERPWQVRLGDDPSWSNIPLPARYGISPDMLVDE